MNSIRLELGTSFALTAFFSVIHLGALLLALSLPILWFWRAGVAALVVLNGSYVVWRYALRRSANAVVELEWKGGETGNDCAIRVRNAQSWHDGKVIERWLHARLVVLVVRCRERRGSFSVLVPADAVDAEAFRRLRVALNLHSAAG